MSLTLTIKRGGGSSTGSGSDFYLYDTVEGETISSVNNLKGATAQSSVNGKNLLNPASVSLSTTASFAGTQGNTYSTSSNQYRDFVVIKVQPNKTYAISASGEGYADYTRFYIAGLATATTESGETWGWIVKSGTFTTGPNTNYIGIIIRPQNSGGDISPQTLQLVEDCELQLEQNTSATEYEPFIGGEPSPNPYKAETVQVVTGTQTVTVTDDDTLSQTYDLDLGTIELCKIGTAQDKIHKVGDDWYLHKEVGKYEITGSENWVAYDHLYYLAKTAFTGLDLPQTGTNILCNYFKATSDYTVANEHIGRLYSGASALNFNYDNAGNALAAFKTWLTTAGVIVYAPLITATDTLITDATLLSQLEALEGATTYDITTHFVVSGSDLPLSLEVSINTGGGVEKTYTEIELGSPFTITDNEGKSQNTTLDGNVFVDYAYSKKSFTVDIFNLSTTDYADIRAFYDYQFTNARFPVISIPELNISEMPVYMEISSRNIVNQCLMTDRLTLKFRETTQP